MYMPTSQRPRSSRSNKNNRQQMQSSQRPTSPQFGQQTPYMNNNPGAMQRQNSMGKFPTYVPKPKSDPYQEGGKHRRKSRKTRRR
jgi:hypothetical protein